MSLSDEDLTRIEALAAGTGLVESRDLRLLVKEVREHRKHIGQLQERLAKRRQSFRDLERRTKTLEGARKAIQELGKKLFLERVMAKVERKKALDDAVAAEREACATLCEAERQWIYPSAFTAEIVGKVLADKIRLRGQVGETSISPSSVGDGPTGERG